MRFNLSSNPVDQGAHLGDFRRVLGKRRAPEFEEWLERMGITNTHGELIAQREETQALLGLASGF